MESPEISLWDQMGIFQMESILSNSPPLLETFIFWVEMGWGIGHLSHRGPNYTLKLALRGSARFHKAYIDAGTHWDPVA